MRPVHVDEPLKRLGVWLAINAGWMDAEVLAAMSHTDVDLLIEALNRSAVPEALEQVGDKAQRMIVYIVDRSGELDVYGDFHDAQRAVAALNGLESDPASEFAIVEQHVFASTEEESDGGIPTAQSMETRRWLDYLEAGEEVEL